MLLSKGGEHELGWAKAVYFKRFEWEGKENRYTSGVALQYYKYSKMAGTLDWYRVV